MSLGFVTYPPIPWWYHLLTFAVCSSLFMDSVFCWLVLEIGHIYHSDCVLSLFELLTLFYLCRSSGIFLHFACNLQIEKFAILLLYVTELSHNPAWTHKIVLNFIHNTHYWNSNEYYHNARAMSKVGRWRRMGKGGQAHLRGLFQLLPPSGQPTHSTLFSLHSMPSLFETTSYGEPAADQHNKECYL